ncbi:hypothetical protein J1N35_019354 [Gossypium stocksii]|uniref:DUF569 domain-containing protein n=1 Tax=Gossypium stocksii TaxID=47602 RepID=A0A9D3VS01_9ROSI|nr:hypothetical protein J1N35_019354 [Gossypium stocksii]
MEDSVVTLASTYSPTRTRKLSGKAETAPPKARVGRSSSSKAIAISHLIRLKSIYKYLTASGEPFLLGMIGNKVLQTIPSSRNDGFMEWEPTKDRFQVKFRARNGQLLRATGGPPLWRNSVTHDIPHRTATQDWVLWGVDLVEILEPDLSKFSYNSERSQHSDKGSASLITHNFKHAFGREERTPVRRAFDFIGTPKRAYDVLVFEDSQWRRRVNCAALARSTKRRLCYFGVRRPRASSSGVVRAEGAHGAGYGAREKGTLGFSDST